MIIVKLMGGLGNQMFQYAAGRRLALHHGTELKLDLSDYHGGTDRRPPGLEKFSRKYALDVFRIEAVEATDEEIADMRDAYYTATTTSRFVRRIRLLHPGFLWPGTHYQEAGYRFDPAVLQLPDHRYLMGFWQSERYFSDIESEIREEFQLRDQAVGERARQRVDSARQDNAPVISVHVRRGDLAHAHEVLKRADKTHGAPVNLDYINQAMEQFPKECCFLVFSDTAEDIAWCRENIHAKRIAFADARSDIEDFATMSACDHHIISNSTFSWWAAWLNPKPDKRVICPRTWASPLARTQMPTEDLLPTSWTKL